MRPLLRALPLALLIVVATLGSEGVSPEANSSAEPLQSSSECYSFNASTDDCTIGYQRTQCLGGTDCNDDPSTGYAIHPGSTEICEDGIDNDCQDGDAAPREDRLSAMMVLITMAMA
jgi:hypothetical protein